MNSSTSSSSTKTALKFAAHFALFGVSLFVVLEMFFRFVLPACETPKGHMDNEYRVRNWDPDYRSEGTFSYGRYCAGQFRWRINSAGWNSAFEYLPAESRNQPLVAILGDSYLEGFYSDPDEHIDAILYELFEENVCFYTFGMSGAYLSQHVATCTYINDTYDPDIYVIFLNAKDVESSIQNLSGPHRYLHKIVKNEDGSYSDVFPNLQARPQLYDFVLRSSIIRYLRRNAQVLFAAGDGVVDVNANMAVVDANQIDEYSDIDSTDIETIETLESGARYMLNSLAGFEKHVIFVSDGPRNLLYAGALNVSLSADSRLIQELCLEYPAITFIDLMPTFEENFLENGREFNFPDNSHWNTYGNEVIAEALVNVINDHLDIDSRENGH